MTLQSHKKPIESRKKMRDELPPPDGSAYTTPDSFVPIVLAVFHPLTGDS